MAINPIEVVKAARAWRDAKRAFYAADDSSEHQRSKLYAAFIKSEQELVMAVDVYESAHKIPDALKGVVK